MNEEESGEPTPQGMVGGASAYGNQRPRVLCFALKEGSGLLLWESVVDRADRQWAEVPPMPEVERELRTAHARAMAQAPEGARARQGQGVGLPKVEVEHDGDVRVDYTLSGRLRPTRLTRLSAAAHAAIWKLWREPLPVAEIPRSRPVTFPRPTPGRGEVVGVGPAPSFESEKELEDYMVSNWDKLPFSDTLEIIGRQYPTRGHERIDILCSSKDNSGYTVFELKLRRTDDVALAQVQRYMRWVRGDRVKGTQSVWGTIICLKADTNLIEGVSEARNVDGYTYAWQRGQLVFSEFTGKDRGRGVA
jgi:hypothetical protein